MPVKRRRRKERRGYSDDHILHLTLGIDWFDGFGRADRLAGIEREQRQAEIRAAMQEAWSLRDVRRRCYALLSERQARGVSQCYREPWAATEFGGETCHV